MQNLTKVVALLIISAVAGSPVPTITASSSYYDQLFSDSDGVSFGDAVNNFFYESL